MGTSGHKESYDDDDDYQECNLLWLDPKINNDENREYQRIIKRIRKITFYPFTDIKLCIDKLKQIKFEKTFVLVSGSLSNDFFIEIEKNINIINVLPVIMIFTSYRKANIIKQNILNLNYKLFDINLIFSNFESVIQNLKYKKVYEPNHSEITNFENDETFCFEYIQESNELILPLYYADYFDYPTKKDILDFNKFILDKYSGVDELKVLIEQLFLNIDIPCEILIKY